MLAPRSSKVTLTPGYLGSLLPAALLQGGVRVLKDGTDLNQTGSFYLAARPMQKKTALYSGCTGNLSEADALTRSQREQSIAFTGKTMGFTGTGDCLLLRSSPSYHHQNRLTPRLPPLQQQTADLFYENRLMPKKSIFASASGSPLNWKENNYESEYVLVLPTHGDGHYLGTEEGSRPVDHGYLQQIAQAADRLGYTGVLIPTGRSCEDAWLVAASMILVTQRLKFLVALRPSVTSPTVAARRAARLTVSRMVVRCLIWSQAAIHKSWQATACSLIIASATKPRRNLPVSGGAYCWGNRQFQR